MRTLVLGAGAIGGYFGGRLVESGADVTFLVRDRRKAQLLESGLVVKSARGDIAFPVNALTVEEIDGVFDLVLVACKAYDLEVAISTLSPAIGSASMILPLLNGLRHLDRLAERFGSTRVLGGTCYIGGALYSNGEIRHIGERDRLIFGELSGDCTPRVRKIADLFGKTKCDGTLSSAVLQDMWEKFVMLASMAAATTLTRAATFGEIVAVPTGERLLLDLLDECISVAKGQGYPPRDAWLESTRTFMTTPNSPFGTSMRHDLVSGCRTEGEHVIGDLVRRAQEHSLDVPILRTALTNLQIHERRIAARSE